LQGEFESGRLNQRYVALGSPPKSGFPHRLGHIIPGALRGEAMKEKERRQLFGEAVCGFVNADTTDEACFAILTGIQKISRFSSSFIEKVKEVFPAMSNITAPPKDSEEEREDWIRVNTISLHDGIKIHREMMRRVFDSLLHGRKTLDFGAYLGIYNELSKSIERRANPIKIDLRDGKRGPYPISEEGYLSTKLPDWHDRIVNDLAYCLIEFLVSEDKKNLTEYKKYLKRCDVCSKFLVHPTRKRCPGECTRIATKKYDTEYKQFVRWELFVDDVKKKCKTIDDLYNNDNTNLLTRARRFKCGFDEVIERLKKVL
jgi:hypothetical protein